MMLGATHLNDTFVTPTWCVLGEAILSTLHEKGKGLESGVVWESFFHLTS